MHQQEVLWCLPNLNLGKTPSQSPGKIFSQEMEAVSYLCWQACSSLQDVTDPEAPLLCAARHLCHYLIVPPRSAPHLPLLIGEAEGTNFIGQIILSSHHLG
ncbi:unnamed protein product [Natator depressus]